jgi:CRP-like cAMP-binding protein
MALDQFHAFLQAIHPLSTAAWTDLSAICQPFSAKRKVMLTEEGQLERYLYFVAEGVQRVYAINPEGREATLVFTYAPSFGGVADAFLLQQPSRYYYETLTPSTFLRVPYSQLEVLMEQHPSLQKMVLLATSHGLSGVLARQAELQCMNAEQRFRSLLKRSPHILHLVPHKYLADYIGIDATNFSKFLASIRI